MMNMIERVARALAASDSGPEGSKLFRIHWEEFEPGYMNSARAAIEAMMEPTPEMIAAVDKVQENGSYVMYETVEWQDAWPVAITAALEE